MKSLTKKITTNTRVIKEHLNKYRDTVHALKELINNSIQADSKRINLNIEYNPQEVSGISFIEITDDGYGVSINEFQRKILEIGTTVKEKGLGVGRFGALQIGELMHIETVAYDTVQNEYSITKFSIDTLDLADTQFEDTELQVDYDWLGGKKQNTYYKIRIEKLYHNSKTKHYKPPKKNEITSQLLEENIKETLFINYPSEIFNSSIQFYVNGEKLDRNDFVIGKPTIKQVPYTDMRGDELMTQISFYNIKSNNKTITVFFQIDNAGIKSVASEYTFSSDWITPELGAWYIYVESPLLSSDLFRNLDIESIDKEERISFETHIKDEINAFFSKENKAFKDFITSLENDRYYPYKTSQPTSIMQELLFKKVAFLLENQHGLLRNGTKIREFLYAVLDRSLADGNVEYVFKKVHELSEPAIANFSHLLHKTDLENIVHFNSQVSKKLEFLDFLHKIVYSQIAKSLRERKQLHKIIEKNLWIFGEQYNDTPALWSDKNIGNTLKELRDKHLKTEFTYESDSNVIEFEESIEGISDITDLFFLNEKISDDGVKEIMVVELKAPCCAISDKEMSQISRYAFTIEEFPGLPSQGVRYKLILISSKLTRFAQSNIKSKRDAYPNIPFLVERKKDRDIEVYVMTWAELIESNRRKLGYLSNQLEVKDKSAADIFEEEYSHLIDEKLSAELKLSRMKK